MVNVWLLGFLLVVPVWGVFPPLAIAHVTVIDVAGHRPRRPDSTVFITGGRIQSVTAARKAHLPPGVQVIDGTGKFLIPGLWDMHVHTLWKGKPAATYPLFLANGVVGLRDMGGSIDVLDQTRQQIRQGRLPPLHLAAAGPLLDARVYSPQNSVAVGTADQARDIAALLKQRGVDFLKVGTYLKREVYQAILKAGREQHLPVVGHVPFTVTAEEASRAGQRSIEHLTGLLEGCTATPLVWEQKLAQDPFGRVTYARDLIQAYDPVRAKRLFAGFAKRKTYQTPTLTVIHPWVYPSADQFFNDPNVRYLTPELTEDMRGSGQFLYHFIGSTPAQEADKRLIFQKYLDLVRQLHQAHVPLLAGTDTFFTVPGFGLHEELALLVMAGLSPLEAIQTATRNPARFFGREHETGTIQRGRIADLVLLDADPLDDIHNTQKIAAVILAGQLYDKAALTGLLAGAEAANHRH